MYIQDTDDIIITSSLSSIAAVAEWRSLSISSFMLASFSIYVSLWATYASADNNHSNLRIQLHYLERIP